MEMVISRQYSKEISRRTRRGLKYKLDQKHEWPGWAPLGYINVNEETQTLAGSMNPYKKQIQKMLLKKWLKSNYTPSKIEG
jgi:DNA invertase Pin-like site-specific DNA recombinase